MAVTITARDNNVTMREADRWSVSKERVLHVYRKNSSVPIASFDQGEWRHVCVTEACALS